MYKHCIKTNLTLKKTFKLKPQVKKISNIVVLINDNVVKMLSI